MRAPTESPRTPPRCLHPLKRGIYWSEPNPSRLLSGTKGLPAWRLEVDRLPDLPNHLAPSQPGSSDLARRAVILCVERDPHVRELEAYFLSEAGFEVTFAADGVEALELARKLRPSIVITEILVPKLDGLALCRQLKADVATSGTAVLVFSLLAAEGRAHDAGADAFLGKPLAAQRLTDTVRRLLATVRRPTPESTS